MNSLEQRTATSIRSWIVPFIATLLAMLCLQASNLGFSPLLPSIQAEYKLTFASMGLFAGMYGLISVFVSIPAGLIIKRFGEKAILSGGLLVVALGLTLLSRAPSFTAAFVGRAVWLTGYRFSFICVMTAIALTCPAQVRGRCMGILGAMSALASVLGAPFGSAIGRDFGWRNGVLAFAGIAIVGAIVFTPLYRSVQHQSSATSKSKGTPTSSAGAFSSPLVWAVAVLSGLSGVTSLTTNFFLPSAARGVFHLDQVSAAYMISTGFMVAIFVNLLFGFLMDRFHKWSVMTLLSVLLIAGSLMMTSREILIFRIGATLVLALGHAAIQQSYSIASEVLHGRETGNVMGIVSGVAGIVNYLTPQALGILRDRSGGFDAGWYTLAALSTVTLVLVLALWRRSALVQRPVEALA
jgi:predicted MFS family arabinose efflux permease